MSLDVDTMLVMVLTLATANGAMLLFKWRQRPAQRAYPWWAAGFGLIGLGAVLYAGRETLPDVLSVTLAYAAVMAGMGCWDAGLRSLDDKPVSWLVLLGPSVTWTVLAGVPVIDAAILSSLLLALIAAAVAYRLLRDGPQPSVHCRLLGWIAALFGVLFLSDDVYLMLTSTAYDARAADASFVFTVAELFVLMIAITVIGTALVHERTEWQLIDAAEHDQLTRVKNRLGFHNHGGRLVGALHRERRQAALLLFDLDRFKSVNDRFGHAVGDLVLQCFARETVRLLPAGSVFGRLGGEEFAAFVPDLDEQAAVRLGESVRQALSEQIISASGAPVVVTASVGVSCGREDALDLSRLLSAADAALYVAKLRGRDRVHRALAEVA